MSYIPFFKVCVTCIICIAIIELIEENLCRIVENKESGLKSWSPLKSDIEQVFCQLSAAKGEDQCPLLSQLQSQLLTLILPPSENK